ncbi:MAG: hypothetical protein QW841_05040 [Candidatus Aenigmatarchaeota archaeon]
MSYTNQKLPLRKPFTKFRLFILIITFYPLFLTTILPFIVYFIEWKIFISSNEVFQFLYEATVKNRTLPDYKNNFNLKNDGKTVILTIDPIKNVLWKEKALKLLSIGRFRSVEDVKFIRRVKLIQKLNSYPTLYCYHGFDRKTIQCEFQTNSVDTYTYGRSEELIKDTVPSIVLNTIVVKTFEMKLDKNRKSEQVNPCSNFIDWMVYLDPLENEEALKKVISLSQKGNKSILIHFIVYNESKIDEVIEKYKNADFLTDEEKKRLNKENILRNNFIAFKYGIKKLPLVLTLTFNNETEKCEYKKCEDCL